MAKQVQRHLHVSTIHCGKHSWIQGYTGHTRIRECTDTHSVSVGIKFRTLLYSMYLGKYCAVFKIQDMKYLI